MVTLPFVNTPDGAALDAEIRFHFESQVADKMRSGEAEALRTARLEFGSLEQVNQDCGEGRGTLRAVLWCTCCDLSRE
jgi:hypothetical protein